MSTTTFKPRFKAFTWDVRFPDYKKQNYLLDVLAINFQEQEVAVPYKGKQIRAAKLDDVALLQALGIKDSTGKEFYTGYVGEFPNGDRFVLCFHDYLDVYKQWIGKPKCEDQGYPLERISVAKIIGNIFENPELLEVSGEK